MESTHERIYFWMVDGIHLNYLIVGYSCRYLFFHQPFNFLLFKAKEMKLIRSEQKRSGRSEAINEWSAAGNIKNNHSTKFKFNYDWGSG